MHIRIVHSISEYISKYYYYDFSVFTIRYIPNAKKKLQATSFCNDKIQVMRLMHTDLLRQGEVWREEMKNVRNIVTNLETKGYTNLQAFKIHWDHQLYKVLEYQYLIGISDLSHRLPDIHVDIVFRQQEIQYRPSMEEIRSAYYSQLRRFIERPLTFIGLSEQSSNIFKAMVEM